jgi:hypothetical protein
MKGLFALLSGAATDPYKEPFQAWPERPSRRAGAIVIVSGCASWGRGKGCGLRPRPVSSNTENARKTPKPPNRSSQGYAVPRSEVRRKPAWLRGIRRKSPLLARVPNTLHTREVAGSIPAAPIGSLDEVALGLD